MYVCMYALTFVCVHTRVDVCRVSGLLIQHMGKRGTSGSRTSAFSPSQRKVRKSPLGIPLLSGIESEALPPSHSSIHKVSESPP